MSNLAVVKPLPKHWENDKLGRAAVGADFSKLIKGLCSSQKNIAYVVCIDAPYGHGKSFFVDCWRKELGESYKTLFYDAWRFDYSDDPFTTFTAEIIGQLSNIAESGWEELKAILEEMTSFYRIFWPLIKSVHNIPDEFSAEIVAQAKKYLDTGKIKDFIQNAKKTRGERKQEKYLTTDLLDMHRQAQKGLEAFQEFLTLAASEVKTKTGNPLIIFIDEIDRCKPTYAIRLLERIKHIFNVPNIIFILATNKNSLVQSIKAVYGHEFESREYLERFFDLSLKLPPYDAELLIKNKLANLPITPQEFNSYAALLPVERAVKMFSQYLDLSLRETAKALELALLAFHAVDFTGLTASAKSFLLHEYLLCCCVRIHTNENFSSGLGTAIMGSHSFNAALKQQHEKIEAPWKRASLQEKYDMEHIIEALFMPEDAARDAFYKLENIRVTRAGDPKRNFALELYRGAVHLLSEKDMRTCTQGIGPYIMNKLAYIQLPDANETEGAD